MAEKDLCAQALAIGDYVMGAFFVQAGNLVHWRMRVGLKLPDSEKTGALMFQRTLIHGMLKMREEYVGKMYFAMSSYEHMDIFHFGIEDTKPTILIITVKQPYEMQDFVPKAMRLVSRVGS